VAGIRRSTTLNVYLDVATLAGLNNQPGELAGYGVITADTARALAASADTIRALIHQPAPTTVAETANTTRGVATNPPSTGHATNPPGTNPPGHASSPARRRVCGSVLDAGRTVYRPPDATLDYVTARDRVCTWPGCRAPAQRCDTDHRHPYNTGGATCPCNLDLLCRFHHQVKTFTAWQAHPGPNGLLIWTSPTGHHYPTEPAHPLLDQPSGTTANAERVGSPGTLKFTPDLHDDPPPF
jgi:hypothetical protein